MSCCRGRTESCTSGPWRNAAWISASNMWCLNAVPNRWDSSNQRAAHTHALNTPQWWHLRHLHQKHPTFICNECTYKGCLLYAFYVFYTSSHLQRYFISTSQALDWLQEAGEYFLSTHNTLGDSAEKTQELLKEYENFCVSAKVCITHS